MEAWTVVWPLLLVSYCTCFQRPPCI